MDHSPPPPAASPAPLADAPDHPQEQPRPRRGTLPAFAPVPRLKDRSNGWKPHIQRAFIEALADTGSVASACRRVGRSTHGAYHLRRQPGAAEFAAAWEAALDCGIQRIEDVAMDRALNGVEVPVYSYGKHIGERVIYNDRLLMFLLRNRAPERFGAGPNGGQARGPGAIGVMERARLKKQWRTEWEAEQRKVSPAEVRAQIEAKVEAFRTTLRRSERRDWARMSQEARDAFVAYTQLRARDLGGAVEVPYFLEEAEGDAPRENWWDAPEAWREAGDGYGERAEAREEAVLPAPPERGEEAEVVEEEPPAEPGPRLWSLKDDGWR